MHLHSSKVAIQAGKSVIPHDLDKTFIPIAVVYANHLSVRGSGDCLRVRAPGQIRLRFRPGVNDGACADGQIKLRAGFAKHQHRFRKQCAHKGQLAQLFVQQRLICRCGHDRIRRFIKGRDCAGSKNDCADDKRR